MRNDKHKIKLMFAKSIVIIILIRGAYETVIKFSIRTARVDIRYKSSNCCRQFVFL